MNVTLDIENLSKWRDLSDLNNHFNASLKGKIVSEKLSFPLSEQSIVHIDIDARRAHAPVLYM